MNCPECDAEINPESIYCHLCAAKLPGKQPAASNSRSKLQGRSTPSKSLAGAKSSTEKEIIWAGTYSAKAMIHYWIFGALVTIILPILLALNSSSYDVWKWSLIAIACMWLAFGFLLLIRKLSVYYELTSHRFIHRRGIFIRVNDQIETIDMDDIAYVQTIIERLVGVGTIHIVSSDRSHPVLKMIGIDRVKVVSEQIDQERRQQRIERGLHIESV